MSKYSIILEFLNWNPEHNKDYITFIEKNNKLNDKIIERLSKELIHLCMNGSDDNLKYINNFLDNGANVDYVDKENICTPLSVICWKGGSNKIAEVLINRGANVNFIGYDGYTPLMFAANRRALSLVQLLLSYGANPNLVNRKGEKAIHIANRDYIYENEKEKNQRLEVEELLMAFTDMN